LNKKYIFFTSSISIVLFLFISGCTTDQNQIDNNESDPCGNDVGNGYEIISGPSAPDFEGDRDNPFRSLTVHPTDPDIVLIGTERNGFVKTTDGGQSWIRIREGLRHDRQGYSEIYDICWSESNTDVIYAVLTDGPCPITGNYPASGGGVYKSTDGGKNWVRKNCDLPNLAVLCVYVDPNDENHVFIGIEAGIPSFTGFDVSDTYLNGGIYETLDGGEIWQEVEIGSLDYKNTYHQICSARRDSQLLYAAGIEDRQVTPNEENIGFVKSMDGGQTWTQFASELRETGVNYFGISSDGMTIYAMTIDDIHISNDGGNTWFSKGLNFGALYYIAVSPEDKNRVLYAKGSDVYLSTDGLDSEQKVIEVESVADQHFTDIVFSPSNPSIIYAVSSGAYPNTSGYNLYKSLDAGYSFTKLLNIRDEVINVIS